MTQRKSIEQRATDRLFGRRLRTLRGEASQADFAAHLGLTRAALANYELGRARPPDDVIERIVNRLGIERDYLDTGPELADLAEEFERMRGDGDKFTDDERALIRLFRVLKPEDVCSISQRIVHGIGNNSAAAQISDLDSLVSDLARFMLIADGKAEFVRGVAPGTLMRLAAALAARVGGEEKR